MDSVTVEDWGEEIFPEGVGVQWKKWARGRGGKILFFSSAVPTPTPPLHQPSTDQASSYNPRWGY